MTSILTDLYSQIAVLELLESISRCGNVWNRHDYNTYTATIQMHQGVYDFYISSHPETNNYILDVILNGIYYTSISSSDQPQIAELYSKITDSMDFAKQRSLVSDLSALRKCPLGSTPIIIQGGLVGGGQAQIYVIYYATNANSRGVNVNGSSYNIVPTDTTTAGVMISGTATTPEIRLIDLGIGFDDSYILTDLSFRFYTLLSPFTVGIPDSTTQIPSTVSAITTWFTPSTTDAEAFRIQATNILCDQASEWTPSGVLNSGEVNTVISIMHDTITGTKFYFYHAYLNPSKWHNFDYRTNGTQRLCMEFRATSEVGLDDPTFGGVTGSISFDTQPVGPY